MKIIGTVAGFVAFAATLAAIEPAARAAPVTLTWFMWSGSNAEVTAWKHIGDLVTAKYPDIKVDFETASWTDYWTKLPALAASNRLPDIISMQSLRVPGFAQLMEPLNDRIERDHFDVSAFNKSIIAGLSLDQKLYALPYDFGPLIVYYNNDIFAKAGIPAPRPGWTQADFLAAAKTLSMGGHYGAALSVPDAFFAYAASAGAPYLTSGGDLDLTNPMFVATFQSYANIIAKDKAAPLFPSSGTGSASQANGRFVAGDVAMYVDGPWELINTTNSIKFKMGLAPLPAGKAGSITVTIGSGFGISVSSQHKDEAWKAIQVMTGPEAEQYLASNGRAFAARTADQSYWYNTAGRDVEDARAALSAALINAQPYRITASWNTVNDLFEQYAPLAFGGKQTAAQVLSTIQQLAQ
jgi:multiple sugar transport system substrate-binding protein